MDRIGVVGAGAAAAAAAFELAERAPEADVTVLEKSRGLCGRAATRRRGDVTYDYGANYVTADDERVVELLTERLDDEGLVEFDDPVYTFDAGGEVSPGRDEVERKWSYEAGLTQIAKRLLARTDASVHRETRVETLGREREQWRCVDADGREWGPFDALLLTPPAPQTAALVRDAAWDDPARESLAAAVGAVPYRRVWTAVCHYPFELDAPYYALVNPEKDHAVGWIAREECKAGHVPDGESLLVVQASHGWSLEHEDDDPERNVAALTEHAADVVGDGRLADPDWTDWQEWRYALPEAGVAADAVDAAAARGLYVAGDWVAGEGRLHAALRSGIECGVVLADR